jgi:hypothetical protein
MKAWLPAAWALIALLVGLCCPRVALAQVDVDMSVSSREVAVGETLQVRLDAMSSDDQAPSSPELIVPSSFQTRGPSVGSRQQVSISGFNMVRQTGISATWLLTPSQPGIYSIGPASVQLGGQRHAAQAVQVRVLADGQRPRRRARRAPLDPFDSIDPFGNGGNFDDLFERLRGSTSRFDQLPAAPSDLVPVHPPDPVAFLDARLDTRRAVVGQQITLSIYAHGAEGLFQEAGGAREPTHPDFLANRIVEDGSHQPVYQYTLDGQRWIAVKVREIALFPLHTGQLEIGPLEFGFLGRRYGNRTADGLRRSSSALTVEVSEPPALGRPAGYTGEVGDFQLSAVVEPRSIAVGGSISVIARVQGTGRLPGTLKLPERAGVQWLEPTVRDALTVTGSTLGGSRSFSYLVRMTAPGRLDLGRLSLPLYDPATRRYRVAEATLGEVTVEAAPAAQGAAAASGKDAQHPGPHLSELVSFRPALGPSRPPSYLADRRVFWWLLGLGPLLVLGVVSVVALGRRVRQRLAVRELSQAVHATRALGDARQALAAAELQGVASAVERAIYNAIEWATGLKARAVLRADLERTLITGGLPPELAARSVELLDASARLRFGGEGERAGSLIADVEALVKRLVRRPAGRVPAVGQAEAWR